MLKMNEDTDEPPSTPAPAPGNIYNTAQGADQPAPSNEGGFFGIIKGMIGSKSDATLRETIEEYIETETGDSDTPSVSAHEKKLIANVLEMHDMSAADIMVPRADIVAISEETSSEDLMALLTEKQYSRIPVYKETLDNVTGAIHAKDILAVLAKGEKPEIASLVRSLPIVSPSLHLLDLLLQMRLTRKHMVMVIDEFGGIDGLVTIGDVIEAIVGEIDDEHDPEDHPQLTVTSDGKIIADARYDLEEFEERFGDILSEEERENNDTLGGLVFTIAGRVPARGEVLTHKETGMVFEILDAGPRRVNRLRIRNIPQKTNE
ncbi:MAG: HlyC/CorC family transporter [Alphaproteobacteria bacterium]|nr:HlyC/CorC family transporter [Alphaproteobacteria bacterium]